jgi:hypothetical protein
MKYEYEEENRMIPQSKQHASYHERRNRKGLHVLKKQKM